MLWDSCGRSSEFSNLVDKTVARCGRLDVAVDNVGTEGQVGPITDQAADAIQNQVKEGVQWLTW